MFVCVYIYIYIYIYSAITLPRDRVNAWRRAKRSSGLIPSFKTRERLRTPACFFKRGSVKKKGSKLKTGALNYVWTNRKLSSSRS